MTLEQLVARINSHPGRELASPIVAIAVCELCQQQFPAPPQDLHRGRRLVCHRRGCRTEFKKLLTRERRVKDTARFTAALKRLNITK